MQNKYKEMAEGDNLSLPVFCVSNEAYHYHSTGCAAAGTPNLDVEVTMISELRRFLYGLPADSQLETFQPHIRNVVPKCIAKLEIWCDSPPPDLSKEMERIIRHTHLVILDLTVEDKS